jgi:multidrug efflux pump subunit AcrA (membrane-fusion protein)
MNAFSKARAATAAVLAIWATSLLVSGCNFLPAEEEILPPPVRAQESVDYDTMTAKLGSIVDELSLTARFYPKDKKTLSFDMQGGRLKRLAVAIGDSVSKDDLIAELESGNLEMDIQLLKIDIEKTQLTIRQLTETDASAYNVKRAKLDLEKQQLKLASIQQKLSQTRILAPVDGVITFLIEAGIGDYIEALESVAVVASMDQLAIITSSTDSNKLPIGGRVTVVYGTQTLDGEVVANPSTLYNEPEESIRSSAIIMLDKGLPDGAEMNQSVTVKYIVDRRDNVIVLPRRCINSVGSRRFVNVLEDGVRVERDVEIGLTTMLDAEILSGISEGDVVIFN